MTTFAPDRCLLPLYDGRTEQGRVTTARPFGLTLSTQVGDEVPVVDLADAHLDPVTQTVIGVDGVALGKPQTTQKVTTNSKTSYDHQNFNDSTPDTYQD